MGLAGLVLLPEWQRPAAGLLQHVGALDPDSLRSDGRVKEFVEYF